MEIVVRLIDGKFALKTNVADKVVLLGMLEMAKAVALQPAPSAIETPAPALARQLLATG